MFASTVRVSRGVTVGLGVGVAMGVAVGVGVGGTGPATDTSSSRQKLASWRYRNSNVVDEAVATKEAEVITYRLLIGNGGELVLKSVEPFTIT
jgi:hypothetical protein